MRNSSACRRYVATNCLKNWNNENEKLVLFRKISNKDRDVDILKREWSSVVSEQDMLGSQLKDIVKIEDNAQAAGSVKGWPNPSGLSQQCNNLKDQDRKPLQNCKESGHASNSNSTYLRYKFIRWTEKQITALNEKLLSACRRYVATNCPKS